jgi:transcription elongation factor Elf1
MTKYTCLICGYSGLNYPPRDETGAPSYEICACCGVEFGYEDETILARQEYRKKWIEAGAKWFVPNLKPMNWNLKDQLANIGEDINQLS